MAGYVTPHETTVMLMAVEDTLRNRIRDSLKKPLMAFAEKQIDKAVAEAVEELKIDMAAWRNREHFREEINILYRRG